MTEPCVAWRTWIDTNAFEADPLHVNEERPSYEHTESLLLDYSLCEFFRRPENFYVANLESWAQRRRSFASLLPESDRIQVKHVNPDEQRFLEQVEINRLTDYTSIAPGEDVSPMGRFSICIGSRLLGHAEWADTASFAPRHHLVLTLGASYDGWGSDDRTRRALTLAHGWYGANVHGVLLLLPTISSSGTRARSFMP